MNYNVFVAELATADPTVYLVRPDIERDAPRSLGWLSGVTGRETLRLMGVSETENHASSLERERGRIRDFLARDDQLDWMIERDGVVVGAIWVDQKTTEYLAAPSVSLMIGDPEVRGQGIGSQALSAVVSWLEREQLVSVVYARHLVQNAASARLLKELGFENIGESYEDNDRLQWQNMQHVILVT